MKFLTYLLVLIQAINEFVKWAEESHKQGEEKRKAVVDAVIDLFNVLGIDLTKYRKYIEAIVDIVVTFYNILGIFKHSKEEG